MGAQRKDVSYLRLEVDNRFPVGNRRSRDLVQLKLVASNDFAQGAKKGGGLYDFMSSDENFVFSRLDNMPDPWAPK
jgi:hypothetical protein